MKIEPWLPELWPAVSFDKGYDHKGPDPLPVEHPTS
jgi:hypothetical protein